MKKTEINNILKHETIKMSAKKQVGSNNIL